MGPGVLRLDLGVLVVDPLDQPRAFHDRRDALGQQRGMHLIALHMHVVAGAALVPGDDLMREGSPISAALPFGTSPCMAAIIGGAPVQPTSSS